MMVNLSRITIISIVDFVILVLQLFYCMPTIQASVIPPLLFQQARGGGFLQRTIRKINDTSSDGYDTTDDIVAIDASTTSNSSTQKYYFSPLQMYISCIGIVSLWIVTGTLFYSYCNEWPIPQSFFYAVDAGMSIGFCTNVHETKLLSKAFTILYILLGASVVGGALALFVADIVEGVVDRRMKPRISNYIKEYKLTLDDDVLSNFNLSETSSLTINEFKQLLQSTMKKTAAATTSLSQDDINILWTKFDRIEDGVIYFEEFAGTYLRIEKILASFDDNTSTDNSIIMNIPKKNDGVISSPHWFPTTRRKVFSKLFHLKGCMRSSVRSVIDENRIYGIFFAWVLLGIMWGMGDMGWDFITATHFAVSALATGGLTAPPVDNDGILPPRSSIFCGCYCLFGIPLMAITFGHFARILVSDHVEKMEEWALTRPMTATEYHIAKKYLTKTAWRQRSPSSPQLIPKLETKRNSLFGSAKEKQQLHDSSYIPSVSVSATDAWRGLYLSDFIVLQLLRQGRISDTHVSILKKEFNLLDVDNTGILTLEEATNWLPVDEID